MTHGRRLAAHRSVSGTKSRSRDSDIQRVDLFAIGSGLDVLVLQRREAAFIRPDDLMLICSSSHKYEQRHHQQNQVLSETSSSTLTPETAQKHSEECR
ncbi:hypothetical protein INR49_019398 [Caranx melampygus]|nr:hypothetical protein INR49_019398 [Caranx melampygus]